MSRPTVSTRQAAPIAESVRPGADRIVDAALTILRERRGVDFGGYRRATIVRRLVNRMVRVGVLDGDDYLAHLAGSDSEAEQLAKNLTIKVSQFYRNWAVFELLRDQVIPSLRERFDGALRVWSAGCAAGEEAYSLAMLLRPDDRVCGTDIDESALQTGRRGRYDVRVFDDVPTARAQEFFSRAGHDGFLQLSDAVRTRVSFVQHDLAAAAVPPEGAPFHLICCRNVLIYFSRPLQQRAMNLLYASLAPGGVLCLGEAEWPVDQRSMLQVIDRRSRLFRRLAAQEVEA